MLASRTESPRDDVAVGSLPEAKDGLPLVLTPKLDARAESLAALLRTRRDWVHDRMREHGAILMRGFDVFSPEAFERVARAIDDDLKNEYLGTSPRDALTSHVFNASELPGFYPIPQHCEMTFVRNHPRRIFFCCMVPPEHGGETPLVDFRRVYAELDPAVVGRFEKRGIKIIRNYSGPDGGGKLDLWKLKPWHEMFRTQDRTVVEEACRREEFEPTWREGGKLRLVSRHVPVKRHPETGEPVWFNHSLVFHLSAAPGEYRRIYERRRDLRSYFFWQLSRVLVTLKRGTPADAQAMHCTYLDGAEIPAADMEHLRDVVWRNLVVFRWQRGDVVAIDNLSVGHGRLPYHGPRHVIVCWS
jgi:alpha-ketoglutarate-dependent taurine dioxygenase